MPLRSRIPLLAGMAAVVGLCAGCQTSSLQTAGAGRPGVTLVQPFVALYHRVAPARSRPRRRMPAAPQGTVIASSSPVGRPPRPAAPPLASDGEASVWQPVRRVGAERPANAPPAAGVTPASAPDLPGGAIRASIETPVPQPVTIASGNAPNDPPVAPPMPNNPPPPPPPHLEPQPVAAIAPPVIAHPAAPREFAKQPLPPYVVEPPDILLIQATPDVTLPNRTIDGQHLVRPDGTISLGIYGNVYVAGSTLEEVRDAVAAQIHVSVTKESLDDIKKGVIADVLAYNSKVYYVITDGGGYGEQVYPIASTGNETVLDAMSKINGLPSVASKKRIWVARATPNCNHPEILPVDWCGITRRGCADTNYQIFPGDRVYVDSDKWIATDSFLAKRLNPVERILGTILLGSSTVNSIKSGSNNGTGTGG